MNKPFSCRASPPTEVLDFPRGGRKTLVQNLYVGI